MDRDTKKALISLINHLFSFPILLLFCIYIDSRRVQDQFTPKPDQARGRHRKCRHVDHLEIRYLGNKNKAHDLHKYRALIASRKFNKKIH